MIFVGAGACPAVLAGSNLPLQLSMDRFVRSYRIDAFGKKDYS
jgi:hypothetical protein